MSQIYTVPTPYYLQWHDEGTGQGTWYGSATSTSEGFYTLDDWQLASGPNEYDFHFTTHQGTGNPYTVFATMTDAVANVVYGAKFVQLSELTSFTPKGSLALAAGKLISDDPKLQVSSDQTKPPTSYLKWDGTNWWWSYQDNDPNPTRYTEPIPMAYSGGYWTVKVTDTTSTSNTCAVYYVDQEQAPGTNVGVVQYQTTVSGPDTYVPIRCSQTDGWTCTLNLFTALPVNATLSMAPR